MPALKVAQEVVNEPCENIIDLTEPIVEPPKKKNEISEDELRNINRMLKATSLVPAKIAQLKFDLEREIRSTVITDATKLLMLKKNIDFVRKTCENMKVLQALDMEMNDLQEMSKEERQLRENYAIIEKLFQGQAGIEKYLDDLEFEQEKQKMLDDEEDTSDSDDMTDEQWQACMDKVFEGCEDLGYCCDNTDYIEEELKKTKRYQQFMAAAAAAANKDNDEEGTAGAANESIVFNTMLPSDINTNDEDESMHFNVTESKYSSQWEEFAKCNIPNKSTPIQGALAKAFQRQEQKAKKPATFMAKLTACKAKDEIDITDDDDDDDDDDFSCLTETLKDLQTKACEYFKENDTSFNADNSTVKKSSFKSSNKCDATEITPDNLSNELKSFLNSNASKMLEQNAAYEQNNKTNNYKNNNSNNSNNTNDELLTELDIDMSVFLEPFPEELNEQNSIDSKQITTPKATATTASTPKVATTAARTHRLSSKENLATKNISKISKSIGFITAADMATSNSPDLFDLNDTLRMPSPAKPALIKNNISLAAKLAAKQIALISPNKSSTLKSVESCLGSPQRAAVIKPTTSTAKHERSPSLFDIYKKGIQRQNSKISKSLLNVNENDKDNSKNNINSTLKDIDSPILLKRKNSKRKIFDSSDDEDEEPRFKNETTVNNAETTDCEQEEIITTPTNVKQRNLRALRQRRKRQQLCAFVEREAAVSGSEQDCDDDAADVTGYELDSIVVATDNEDETENAVSATQMQGIYLKSLKSPKQRQGSGGFKIPAFREYKDHADIYSQPVLPVEHSQYMLDSFLVDEENKCAAEPNEVSICPLEQAERILKERRRARRQFGKVAAVNKKRKQRIVFEPNDESSDDDFE